MLARSVRGELEGHPSRVRVLYDGDLREGGGFVELPGALGRKHPGAGRSWPWQWVFPARRRYRDPEAGELRRNHLHESVVQRAMAAAVRASGIGKRASCLTLRHPFATHLSEAGYDIQTVQESPGSPGRVDHHDLHARLEPWWPVGSEPCGLAGWPFPSIKVAGLDGWA